MRAEQAHPVPFGREVAVSRAIANHASGRADDQDPEEALLRRGNTQQAVVAGPEDEWTDVELAHRAVHDGDPIVAIVAYPDVTEPLLGVARGSGGGGPVTVDSVVVQVERDIVGTDDDPVVGAVDEVVVEGRVGGDRVAALRL